MLDQNTDRMWYVIGAVIIGAAIILILNNTFPQLFASVGETFKDKTEDVGKVVGDISPDKGVGQITDGVMPVKKNEFMISETDLKVLNADKVGFDTATNTWTLDIHPPKGIANWWSNGLSFVNGKVVIPYGSTLKISYEIFIPEGVEGMYANNDINNAPVDASIPAWSGNDNDELGSRRYNTRSPRSDSTLPIDLTAGEWRTVSFSSTNTNAKNTTKTDLFDFSSFGVYNPKNENVRVQIRNVRGELSK